MTTRQLMMAVAVVAVPLGWVLERRSRFANLAAFHESRQMDGFENYVKPRGGSAFASANQAASRCTVGTETLNASIATPPAIPRFPSRRTRQSRSREFAGHSQRFSLLDQRQEPPPHTDPMSRKHHLAHDRPERYGVTPAISGSARISVTGRGSPGYTDSRGASCRASGLLEAVTALTRGRHLIRGAL
jgi:hypothetical protein